MIACGLPDVSMTSIAAELGDPNAAGVACFRREMAYRFARAHARRARLVSPRRLGIDAPVARAPRMPRPVSGVWPREPVIA
jgi:hypothetical protein